MRNRQIWPAVLAVITGLLASLPSSAATTSKTTAGTYDLYSSSSSLGNYTTLSRCEAAARNAANAAASSGQYQCRTVATVAVTYTPDPVPTVTLSANPATVAPGGSSTLTWSSTNASTCTASGGWSGNRAASGSATISNLSTTTTYVLKCTGAGGSAQASASVTVAPQPAVTLSANPTTVNSGGSSTLTWSSTNATSCTASGGWAGTRAASGSATFAMLSSTTTYTLSCTGAGGTTAASATVTVAQPAPTVTLSANPASVASGGASTLTWSSTNATSCTASGGWSGSKPTSGTASTGALASSTAFALSCTGAGGTGQSAATVTVSSATPAPVVTITATPAAPASGQPTTLTWSTTNATSCTASSGWSGSKGTYGSQTSGALTATTTFVLSCTGSGGTTQASAQATVGATASPFPLHTEAGKRYLVTAQGTPFLLQGDSPWSLITNLTDAEVDTYLDDRKARGFNTLLVEVIERKFFDPRRTDAPNNRAGDRPFLTPGDFSTPNEAYFAHAVSVVQKARDRGMVVLLCPAYIGYAGTDEGWNAEMQANGNAKLQAYGAYLANRFAGLDNIIWTNGGDANPSDPGPMNAVIAGIRSVNTTWLHTFHGQRGTSSLDFVGASSGWLGVNAVYTRSDDVTAQVASNYGRSDMPNFLVEAYYENENSTTPQIVRQQAYQALLAGSSGQVFGNNPVWYLGSGWQSALSAAGSVSMQRLKALWVSRSWWLLQPSSGLASAGQAALASDRSYALVYTSANTTVQLSQLAGSRVSAQWYNPYTGAYVAIGQYSTAGSQSFTAPGSNGNGTDWVLVLDAN